MKKGAPHAKTINWAAIPPSPYDLSDLDAPFLEDEVNAAIDNSTSDKAPSPDGFMGAFFKACWDIIKGDILAVVNQFSNLHTNNLHWLNSANIALIPKKEGAEEITDFWPISLIHGVAKLIAKMMATRLALHMDNLV
jgi:hypothetical protein